ncbi:MAG: Gfo/Idh/MocA family oxidoreductase [Alphaproteobacteria bacterium]
MATIRWGIVGCGAVCEVKSGPALYKARDSALTAVMRRDGAKAADFARRHGASHWFDDADALIGHPDVDAVYVATPPSSHLTYVRKAAAAGKPVLVEKPMAMSGAECDAMIEACSRAGTGLYVAYYRRALPRFEAFRALAADGRLGRIRMVAVRQFRRADEPPDVAWKTDPAINGGGLFTDTQVHTLDWLDHAFGPALSACGAGVNQAGLYAADDTVGATVVYPGGVVASFACNYVADRHEETVTLIGDRGRASMRFFAPSPITVESDGAVERIDVDDPPHVHQPLVQQIVDHLNGGPAPASAAENGRRVNRLLDAMFSGG